MLIIRSTTHGKDHARVFVTDPESGETVVGTTTIETSDALVGAVRSGSNAITLDIVRKKLGILEKEDMPDIEEIRAKHGIEVSPEGIVTLPNGVVLPNGMREMLLAATKDEDINAVIRFGEKLAQNPLQHAQESLIEWIMKNPSLAITPDGDVVGYRGLNKDFTSIHSGYGIVNGVHYTEAHLDNTPGNVIEFPREMVDHNPNKVCSVGLHVGTWNYASGFTKGRIVIITFNPADVVSPPSDAHQEKIRVCKMVSRAEVKSALPEDRLVVDFDQESED